MAVAVAVKLIAVFIAPVSGPVAVQAREHVGTGLAVKLILGRFAPAMVTDREGGVKVYPEAAGVTV